MSLDSENPSFDQNEAYVIATVMFTDAFRNHYSNFGSISNFRRVVKTGIPLAKRLIANQDVETIRAILSDPKQSVIFRDPDQMEASGEHLRLAEEQTRLSIATAESTIEAASLVFAHAVLDATLFEFCKICSVVSPNDWKGKVEGRKVNFVEIETKGVHGVFTSLIDEYLSQLEKESLLKKADVLHDVTSLGERIPKLQRYEYSRERLKEIDKRRHMIVHRLQFKAEIADVEDDFDYMLHTGFYFLSILNEKYDLKIDPNRRSQSA